MIDNNQTALLELIKCSLFGGEPVLPEGTDWACVLKEAMAQTVVALAAPVVPADFAENWQEPAAQNMAHYMRALFEQANLIKLFEINNIPLVILKGAAAAVYYPKPQLRTMGDIDFLVFEEDFEKAYSLLSDNGYKFECDYEDGRDYTFIKGEVVFELHRRYSDDNFDIEDILINGMKRPVTRTINGMEFFSLPDNENGLILLDHIRHHLKGGLGIRQIIDWMMFVHSVLDDKTFKNSFLPLTDSVGLTKFCLVVTKMCKLYFGLPDDIKWCDGADDLTAKELFYNVLGGGNFGRKQPYTYKPMESLTIAIKKEGFFTALQNAGVENFKICKSNRFFKSFAWLFQLFRYIFRGIKALFSGKRLLKDIEAGNTKADFYTRLGIG